MTDEKEQGEIEKAAWEYTECMTASPFEAFVAGAKWMQERAIAKIEEQVSDGNQKMPSYSAENEYGLLTAADIVRGIK